MYTVTWLIHFQNKEAAEMRVCLFVSASEVTLACLAYRRRALNILQGEDCIDPRDE